MVLDFQTEFILSQGLEFSQPSLDSTLHACICELYNRGLHNKAWSDQIERASVKGADSSEMLSSIDAKD